jgi:hypothetical protein
VKAAAAARRCSLEMQRLVRHWQEHGSEWVAYGVPSKCGEGGLAEGRKNNYCAVLPAAATVTPPPPFPCARKGAAKTLKDDVSELTEPYRMVF